MSVEENKALIRRFIEEFWNEGNLNVLETMIDPDCIAFGRHFGPEGFKQFFDTVRTAFPDLHFSIEDLFAEGDKVALRIVEKGTHEGQWVGIPPTHKQILVGGIAIYRIAGGKIVHQWFYNDWGLEMAQLGARFVPADPGDQSLG